ncbi:MAG: WXG100 family type VII secretion target [Lachnospiraceae bacterium]|nr:WXG100 family type VII secretion target [Lachnospiraceae bacterium]
MAGGIAMTYEIMDQTCTDLTNIVTEIISDKANMMEKVNSLCETWESAASERHLEDFQTVCSNIDTLTELADELISSVKQYRADMEELDQSYA